MAETPPHQLAHMASVDARHFEVNQFASQWKAKLRNAQSIDEIKKLFGPLRKIPANSGMNERFVAKLREAAMEFVEEDLMPDYRSTESFMFGYSGLSFVPSSVLARVFGFIQRPKILVRTAKVCMRFKRILYNPMYNCLGHCKVLFESIGYARFDIEFYEMENTIRCYRQATPPGYKVRKHPPFSGFKVLPSSLSMLIGNANEVIVKEECYMSDPIAIEIMQNAHSLTLDYTPRDMVYDEYRKETQERIPVPTDFIGVRSLRIHSYLLRDCNRDAFPQVTDIELVTSCRDEDFVNYGYRRETRDPCRCREELLEVDDIWLPFIRSAAVLGEFCPVAQRVFLPFTNALTSLDWMGVNRKEITLRHIVIPPVETLYMTMDSIIQKDFDLTACHDVTKFLHVQVKTEHYEYKRYKLHSAVRMFKHFRRFNALETIVIEITDKRLTVDNMLRAMETYRAKKLKAEQEGKVDEADALTRRQSLEHRVRIVFELHMIQRRRYEHDRRQKPFHIMAKDKFDEMKQKWTDMVNEEGFDAHNVEWVLAEDIVLKFREDPFMENVMWSD